MSGFFLFAGLGIWQVERRAWKLDLMQRVEQRVQAPEAPAPGPAVWPMITTKGDEYRHVTATGHYLNERETRVLAVTERGRGYWVLTPLVTPDFTVLVNRGFVPEEVRRWEEVSGTTTVKGLLRLSEPVGGFLRKNDPAHGRWYSRDVAAIAAAEKVGIVAPYFIDADGAANERGAPVGGLTVIRFANNHAVYALTWFGLALLCGWGAWQARRK